jgi:hypothetical protein
LIGPSNIQCCVPVSAPPPASSNSINAAGLDLIESFEGFYANFYIDPVGIKTIGYGHACHVNDCSNLQALNSAGTDNIVGVVISYFVPIFACRNLAPSASSLVSD